MVKKNHHYVPQFYLRLFGVNSKYIHLYNTKNKLHIANANIRHQCYKRKFYGKDEVVENKLSQMEQRCSIVIKTVIRDGKLPIRGSIERRDLLEFVAVQWLRTKSAADEQNRIVEGIVKTLDAEYPGSNDFLDQLRKGVTDPVLLTLGMADSIINTMDDLEFHLVYSGAHRAFITSDAPVVRYNLYNQSIHKMMGMEGTVSRGILFFLPLTPHYMLLLYDPGIYTKIEKNSITQFVNDKDIDALNLLQIIFADESIYFNDAISTAKVDSLVAKSIRYRRASQVITETFDEVGGQNRSGLLVTYHSLPDLHMNLSFIGIKRSARKIPYSSRINDRYRRTIPDMGYAPPPPGPKVFVKKRK